jgi:hypothetical protein
VVKAITIAIGIDFGLLFPLLMILPLFIDEKLFVIAAIAAMMGYVELLCMRMALTEYLAKAAQVNLWWEGIDSTERRVCNV